MPYEKLRQCIRIVAAKLQVAVVEQKESYTSKADVTNGDDIPIYGTDTQNVSFSGKRAKRGLYRCHDGNLLNADVNGAANILRKRYPDAFEGKDLSCLWKTTETVQIQDWYVPGKKKAVKKKHSPSPASRKHHEERKALRRGYFQLFEKEEGTCQAEKTA